MAESGKSLARFWNMAKTSIRNWVESDPSASPVDTAASGTEAEAVGSSPDSGSKNESDTVSTEPRFAIDDDDNDTSALEGELEAELAAIAADRAKSGKNEEKAGSQEAVAANTELEQ